mmetsp:Transcript_21444/g.35500  ORF Transcript_21444/g.35500 Transcript_21444/m.35500 type:complete len:386 (-) Transcript_21444:80-1237(-)|eukprot:CAMPEP_0119008044 /NCGR_PEP_ID=MMETSP1176-20130426/3427_1 /TAXON_ID=265551 /ORGANISM="Synedropsis recta cf, Strain CCMP1620" /LENGTH=385 /DNA_ID=CAMNT_0006960301 /DNA_START=30 /DNA_END=1187 /DNA_ORIENTATION=-
MTSSSPIKQAENCPSSNSINDVAVEGEPQKKTDNSITDSPTEAKKMTKQEALSSVDLSADDKTVCRFLIQNIQARSEHAKSNYHVDLLVSQHGLFDIVLQVWEILMNESLTQDLYTSHLWSLQFNKVRYSYGWRRCSGATVKNHLDEESIIPLKDLNVSTGQKGHFNGESASFDFVLVDADYKHPAAAVDEYPKTTALAASFTSDLSNDWIHSNAGLEQAALEFRKNYKEYIQGDQNEWRHDRQTYEFVLCKPESPRWTHEEETIMGLLLRAGCKFVKSWKSVLQYTLVHRAQTAASGQWYKLQREAYRLEYIGRNLDTEARMVLAKRLAKSHLESALEQGVPPTSPPHPFIKTEEVCRKRGLIDDGMSPETKRHKLQNYHALFG